MTDWHSLWVQNDSEKEKLRSALGSAILMEKPNVKVSVPTEALYMSRNSTLACRALLRWMQIHRVALSQHQYPEMELLKLWGSGDRPGSRLEKCQCVTLCCD